MKNIIAVSSGKGGVGKSTVAVNLAVALAADGAKVGIMDADVYGPNVPMMLGAGGTQPQVINNQLIPTEAHGIRMISKQVTPFAQASTQILQSQGAQALNTWLQSESKAAGVTVNPKYGRLNQQTLAVDRISSTEPSASATPTGSGGGATGAGASSSP